MKNQKRVQKSKKDIVSDMQLVQAADRRRSLVRDIVFPHLVEINENIGYSKVYLQAMSGLIEGVMEESRKKITIADIYDKLVAKLDTIFIKKDPEQAKEYIRYLSLIDKIKEVSVQDFSYAAQLPQYIDGYIAKNESKKSIGIIDVNEILGK